MLGLVGLTQRMRHLPQELSGGEQQRVAIARALSTGAKVILADEPTGNLDTANSEIVVDILQRLAHKQGYCVVIVTHNPEIADSADQVMRMKDGVLQVRQKNKTAEIEFILSELLAGRALQDVYGRRGSHR